MKGGIIKAGSPVICYAEQPEEARVILERMCRNRGAEFLQPDPAAVEVLESGTFGTRFRYRGTETTVPLMGRHQVMNAIGVIEAMEALARRGEAITEEDIARGIAETRWVGRLEQVCDAPRCIIDAAHNPEAVKALAAAIDAYFADTPILTVMGMLADKDYERCIPEIAKRSRRMITVTPDSPRALPAEESAALARQFCGDVTAAESIGSAVDRAFALAKPGELVLICGSLYVIGEAKTYIRKKTTEKE